MPNVPRETLLMQEMVGGDYNRVPVIFQAPDNCIIEGICNFQEAVWGKE